MTMTKEPPQDIYQNASPAPEADVDPLRFVIAKDATNHWIVMETHGLYGGIFVSKEAAVKFADSECGGRTATLEVVSDQSEKMEHGHWSAFTELFHQTV